MDESKQSDQHWSELADLLGLPPEKTNKPVAVPPAPAARPPAEPPVREAAEPAPAAPMPFEEEPRSFEPAPADDGNSWEGEFMEEEGEPTMIVEDIGGLAEMDIAEVPAEAPAEDEKQKRGRRRRRRGRRRGGDRAEGEGREHPAPPRGEQRDRGDRESEGRDRGGRRRPEPAVAAHDDDFDTDVIDERAED